MVHIAEAQIRQQRAGEIEVWIVRGAGYEPSDEIALQREIEQRVGDTVRFSLHYTDAIPRTSQGKLRFVVSTVAEGQLVRAPAPNVPSSTSSL